MALALQNPSNVLAALISFLFTVIFEGSFVFEVDPEILSPNIWRTASAERSTVMVERKAELGRQLNPSTYRKLKTGLVAGLVVQVAWLFT